MFRVSRTLIVIFAIAPSAQAQDDEPVACHACRIEIERAERLGNRDGPGALAGRDLIAFDPANCRISTLSPSYEPVATVPITGYARDALRLVTGEWVLLATVPTPTRAGLPMHVVDLETGEYARSFGSDEPVPSRRLPFADVRRASPAEGNTLWVTYLNRYRFELWSANGDLLRSFEPEQTWFAPWEEHTESNWTERPRPAVLDVWYDPAEWLLRAMVHVPARDWRPREEPTDPAIRESLAEWARLYDVVLQVYDPDGRLLAVRRFDQIFERFLANGWMHASHEDAQGHPFTDVWRPILRR